MAQQTKITNAANLFLNTLEDQKCPVIFYEGNVFQYNGKGAWDLLRSKDDIDKKFENALMAACEEWGAEYSKAHRAIWRTVQTLATATKAKIDAKPYIALKNGTLSFLDRELLEWDDEHYITRRVPFTYDPKAKCPRWLEALERLLRDKSRDAEETRRCIKFLQQWFGVNLVGPAAKQSRYLKKALIFIGRTGSAKSSVTNVFKALIGTENVSSKPLHQISSEFGKADLIGRHAWIADDVTDGNKELDPNGFKVLVTGETVNANRKNRDDVNFVFEGAILMTANGMPKIPDNSGAAFDRLSIIQLKNQFSPETAKKQLEGTAGLVEFLQKHNEFPGIINWALDGFEEAARDKSFTQPKTIRNFVDEKRRDSNSTYDFVREGIVEDPRFTLHIDALAAVAVEFAAQRHARKMSHKQAITELTEVIEEVLQEADIEHDETNSRAKYVNGAKVAPEALAYWALAKDRGNPSIANIDKPHFRRKP